MGSLGSSIFGPGPYWLATYRLVRPDGGPVIPAAFAYDWKKDIKKKLLKNPYMHDRKKLLYQSYTLQIVN